MVAKHESDELSELYEEDITTAERRRMQLDAIFVHVGATRKGIDNLETAVSDIRDGLGRLKENAVTPADCERRHTRVESELKGLSDDIEKIPIRAEKNREGLRKSVTFWLSVIMVMVSLLTSMIVGLVKLGKYLDRADKVLTASQNSEKRMGTRIEELRRNDEADLYRGDELKSRKTDGPKIRALRNPTHQR